MYNVKCIAFFCIRTGIAVVDPMKAAEMALSTARILLESNHSFVDPVIFCTCENSDNGMYNDLMSFVYFLVSKFYLTANHMKESPNNNFVTNVTNTENHNKLV